MIGGERTMSDVKIVIGREDDERYRDGDRSGRQ
jgi:hypothetical protein